MKKIICLLLIITFALSLMTPAYAEPAEGQKPILDVIRDQGDYTPDSNVFNKEKYDETMEGCDFSEDLMLKVYATRVFDEAHLNLDELIKYCEKSVNKLHVVFRDELFTFIEKWDGSIISREQVLDYGEFFCDVAPADAPTYIKDIMNSSIYESKLHIPGMEYTKVICFDGYLFYSGIAVYYVGTDRTIVRYYDYYSVEGTDLLLEDFQIYAAACYENMLMHGDENGSVSLKYFVDNYTVEEAKEYYESAKAERLEKENQIETENLTTGTESNPTNEKDSGTSTLWWIIPTAAAVVLLGGAVAFIALRKKKTKS